MKPWERFRKHDYLSSSMLLNYYSGLLLKVVLTNMQWVTYAFMILATMMNGGLIYMVYPLMVFGKALCEEDMPGKRFWYFVIFYTQSLIFIQYVAQLSIWADSAETPGYGFEFFYWCENHNIGIKRIANIS